MDYEAARERVRSKIEEKCLLRGVDLPGRGGSRYSWMFYMRPGLFDPHFMLDVGRMFLHRCREEIGHTDFQICGLETGAVPLVVGIPLVASLEGVEINAFSVRKEPKEYGLRNSLEGVPNGKRAVIVDDIVNSASSVRKCHDLITGEGVEFSGWVFSIIRKFNPTNHMPPDTRYIHLFDVGEWGLG
jgi:orotate phosphoribosyltransferase